MNKWMWIVCLVIASLPSLRMPVCTAQDRDPIFTADRSDESDRRDENRLKSSRRPLTDDEMVRLRQQELLLEFDAKTSPDHGASIDERLMHTVKDNSPGVRFEEREAYLRILRLSQEVPLRSLERFAAEIRTERRETVPSYRRRPMEEFPQFVDLFAHPEFYRGRPVTVHGIMRKLSKFDLGKNSLELDQAYEGWVYTPDSQGNPLVVVFTSKDERLPVDGDIQEEVHFTGYYFKMYGYDAHDTMRKAPLIIAGEVECFPHPYKSVYQALHPSWYVVTTLTFLLGIYLVWQTNRREMPPRPAAQVEPDFNHFPPREYPARDAHFSRSVIETEDS